jgi:outer membrane protein assembly factor BamB
MHLTRRLPLVLQIAALLWIIAPAGAAEPGELAQRIIADTQARPGFCVVVGGSDARLALALATRTKSVVHIAVTEPARLDAIRKEIRDAGLYGRVSADTASPARLPYTDSIANLVVVEQPAPLAKQGLTEREVLRVVCPGGAAWIGGETARRWRRDGRDEWRQWRHDAARSQTSGDLLAGPPRRLRWIDGPRRSRNHKDYPWAVVSANGRHFAACDEGPRFYTAPARRVLVARDAYNGLLLWKRALLRPQKPDRRATFRPATLCAVGDRVYIVLRDGGRLVELDAATGRTLRTFEERPTVVALLDGALLLSGNGPLRLLDIKTGSLTWTTKLIAGNWVVRDDHIYALFWSRGQGVALACLDLATGRELWRRQDENLKSSRLVTCRDGVLAFAGGRGGTLQVRSAKDGSRLWTHSYKVPGHGGTATNILFGGGLLWIRDAGVRAKYAEREKQAPRPTAWLGFDPKSGSKKRTITGGLTQKCFPYAATPRYMLGGTMNFIDFKTGKNRHGRAVRGVCRFGFFIANGLVYTFPTDCRCYPMLRGTVGLATAEPGYTLAADNAPRLVRGSAFAKASAGGPAGGNDWPMYRGSPQRGAATPGDVPADLASKWNTKLGGPLTAPTVAAGRVFVSRIDAHEVVALNAADGSVAWRRTVGARVDQPPTYDRGRVLFGCRDGRVYCLRASDGELVWQFRAAPNRRRCIAYGQPESLWPIYGSVLVDGGRVFFSAGRHTHLDGGITLFALDAATGDVAWQVRPGKLTYNDTLVKSGPWLFLAYGKYDPKTGANPRTSSSRDRFLYAGGSSTFDDGTYAVRTQWQLRGEASGSLLAFDAGRIVSVNVFSKPEHGEMKYAQTRPGKGDHKLYLKPRGAKPAGGGQQAWKVVLPLRPRAMVLAKNSVFVAGPPDALAADGGLLRAYATADGAEQGAVTLDAAPVFDGMAAAGGRLYLSTLDGKVRCFGKK